ncbi:Uma2 family endonuclease [Stackebrandtia albiflava]|uniref:Uma2 family endonuclease n=2 Tax=Stackebrandtia albiflava TaxID=406432 RepID=A0A562VB88_9ACTN|nr:Uma2 family endonuclease [Stackebrandtia albiflava]
MAAEPDFTFPAVWTEDDLATLPEDGHRYEIVDGSLIMTPPASYHHQSISFNLSLLLHDAAFKGWKVRTELGVRVPGANLVPDIVVLRPDGARPGLWQAAGSVALVVEIASKSTKVFDDEVKKRLYAAAGIPSYWQITQDGDLLAHSGPKPDGYGDTVVAAPGRVFDAAEPFPIRFDPADLAD